MGKTFFKFLGILTITMALAGCVVIINAGKPTPEEQTLMDIQASASQEVAQINQKIQAGGFSVEQLQTLVQQARKTVNENLKKIEGLKLPERAKELAEKTKEYLTKVQQTYEAFLQMSIQAGQKVQELMENLKNMSQPLFNMAKQVEEMKIQFLNELQKAQG